MPDNSMTRSVNLFKLCAECSIKISQQRMNEEQSALIASPAFFGESLFRLK